MAVKQLETRVQNKFDFLSNWQATDIELLPGEIAFVKVIDQKTDQNTGEVYHVPAVLLKVGEADENGNPKAFDALPWLSAKASDVYDWAKQPEKPSYTLEELGAEPVGTVSNHNTDSFSHSDIRALIEALTENKQDKLTFDETPTENSSNPVTSGGIFNFLKNLNFGSEESGGPGVSYSAGNLIEIKNNTIGSTLGNLESTTEETKEIINIGCLIFDEQSEDGMYNFYDFRRNFILPEAEDLLKLEFTSVENLSAIVTDVPVYQYSAAADMTVAFALFNLNQSLEDLLISDSEPTFTKKDETLPAGIVAFIKGPEGSLDSELMLHITDDYTGGSLRVTSTKIKNNYVKLPDTALEAGNNIKIKDGVISTTFGDTITEDYITLVEPTMLEKIPEDENPFTGFNAYIITAERKDDYISVNEPLELYMIDPLGNETNLGIITPKIDPALDSVSNAAGMLLCAANINISNSTSDILAGATLTPIDENNPYMFMFIAAPVVSSGGIIQVGCLTRQTYDGYSIKLRRKNRPYVCGIKYCQSSQILPPFYTWVADSETVLPTGELIHIYAHTTDNPVSYYVGSCCLEDNITFNTLVGIEAKYQVLGMVNISNTLEECFSTGNTIPADSTIPYSLVVLYDYQYDYLAISSQVDIPNLVVNVKVDKSITYINKIPTELLPETSTPEVGNLLEIKDGVINSTLGMPGYGVPYHISTSTLGSYQTSMGVNIWTSALPEGTTFTIDNSLAISITIPDKSKSVQLCGLLLDGSDENNLYFSINTNYTSMEQFYNSYTIPPKDPNLPAFIVYISSSSTGNSSIVVYATRDYSGYTLAFYKAAYGKLPNEALNFDKVPTRGSKNLVKSGDICTALAEKQSTLYYDTVPTAGSLNHLKSGDIYTALGNRSKLEFDNTPVASSTKLMTSGAIYEALRNTSPDINLTFDSTPTEGSENLVKSGAIYTAIQNASGKVKSVNNKTGDVTLTAADVGALPNTTEIPTVPTSISSFVNDSNYITVTEVNTKLSNKQDKISKYVSSINNKTGDVSLTAEDILSGTLSSERLPVIPVSKGGTGNSSIADSSYTTSRYRASSLESADKAPTINGTIVWIYE